MRLQELLILEHSSMAEQEETDLTSEVVDTFNTWHNFLLP